MIDTTKYNPTVAWRTFAKNVIQVTRETITDPATYQVTIKAVDTNNVGANQKEVGMYFTDFIGTPYRITAKNSALSQVTTVNYGYLYNWYAATDVRNIAAAGWHLPTNAEWLALSTYLGGATVSGGHLRETGFLHWDSPNTGADNTSGFSARGSGDRDGTDGLFYYLKTGALWWTADSINASNAYLTRVNNINTTLYDLGNLKTYGCGIRLIKDDSIDPGTYIGNDLKTYSTIKIGTQVWLLENIMETKYRDGSLIPEVTSSVTWPTLTTGARCSFNNTETNAGVTVSSTVDTIIVSDDFRTGYCPTSGKYGFVHKSAYKGYSLYLPSEVFRHLHPIAASNNNKYAVSILWGNDPNPRRIPFVSVTQPSIPNYRTSILDEGGVLFNPMEDYGQNPKFEIWVDIGSNQYVKQAIEPVITRSITDGYIDSVLWSGTGNTISGYIIISR